MAQLIFSSIGAVAGSQLLPAGLTFLGSQISGQVVGQAIGASIGALLDTRLFAQRLEGPRVREIYVTESREGASIPSAFGRSRVGGQVIWAARLQERREDSGGGKTGPQITQYGYTLSLAIGICQGPINGLSRIWANGAPFALSGINWRLYTGDEDQLPDPVIEAVAGAGKAPAYRGLAYIVFEDLPLENFGARIPQFSFEVIRAPGTAVLENTLAAVNIIPASGEFAYATSIVRRVRGPGDEIPDNMNNHVGQADFEVALDQLGSELPNVRHVNLVVGWFGDDLRASRCTIRPGVEQRNKTTKPLVWTVAGTSRDSAYLISRDAGGRPSYGGTPSDTSVSQAVQILKQSGYRVTLYPFLFMDIPRGNMLPDPYGGSEQPAFPWRGRITSDIAPGRTGSADASQPIVTEIAAFFGASQGSLFQIDGPGTVIYNSRPDWKYRHFILYHAALGNSLGVDGFLIGSEMPGLTRLRSDTPGDYPACQHLRDLAADARSILGPDVEISYAADWTEYGGHVPHDAPADLFFPLDPLWADENINHVGLDWYAPMADLRDDASAPSGELLPDPYDIAYLQSNIQGGEAYDWYYASPEDRLAGRRQSISSGPFGQEWAYRQKDIRNWWANPHSESIAGIARPTPWQARMKPVRFVEFGCPAVDRGANQPNLFYDPKSDQSALPAGSSGARDDLGQRRALEAFLLFWANPQNTPMSEVYGGPMLDHAAAWAWDARPYPAFPARTDVWSDGISWQTGHWLNGRVGIPPLGDVIAAICAEADVTNIDVSGVDGIVSGYAFDGPISAREALEPLRIRFGFDVFVRDGNLLFTAGARSPVVVDDEQLVIPEDGGAPMQVTSSDLESLAGELRLRFIDSEGDYLPGIESIEGNPGAPPRDAVLPVVMDRTQARMRALELQAETDARAIRASFALSLAWGATEPGDLLSVAGVNWRVISVSADGATRHIEAVRAWRSGTVLAGAVPTASIPPVIAGTPEVALVNAPLLPGDEDDIRPLAFAYSATWTGPLRLLGGPDAASLTERADIQFPASIGRLTSSLPSARPGRWMWYSIEMELDNGQAISRPKQAVFAGANSALIETDAGWELLQYLQAELTGTSTYRLSGLLRGQQGSDDAALQGASAGASVILQGRDRTRIATTDMEYGLDLHWRAQSGAQPLESDWTGVFTPSKVADKPWSPVHLRLDRTGPDWTIDWIRRARTGGDPWTETEPPIEGVERYLLEIWAGGAQKRTMTVNEPTAHYTENQRQQDGTQSGSVRIRVAQIGPQGQTGYYAHLEVS